MEARLRYSRSLLLQLQEPAVSPAPAPAGTGAIAPEAQSVPAADAASTFLNDNAILILAVLSAALALRVVEGALRVTRRGCHTGTDDDAATQDDDPEHGGGGGEGQEARHGGKLERALPCLAYSAGLELAGSSRSECAICLAAFARGEAVQRGEAVRVLPRCSHGFHARCIDRWLAARPTCPTCRQEPFAETTAPLQMTDSFGPAAIVPLVRVAIIGE